jgi:hypothetical protein
MFRKLALVAFLACSLVGTAFAATAPNGKSSVPNSLIIVPQKAVMTGYKAIPYAVYSVYNQNNQMFLAAFTTRVDAVAYSTKLVKGGVYDSYHYASYDEGYASTKPTAKDVTQ